MLIQNTSEIVQEFVYLYKSVCFTVDTEVGLVLLLGHCDYLT